jgi:hypothetical protein
MIEAHVSVLENYREWVSLSPTLAECMVAELWGSLLAEALKGSTLGHAYHSLDHSLTEYAGEVLSPSR